MGTSCSIVHIKNSAGSSSTKLSPGVSSVILEASEVILRSVVPRKLGEEKIYSGAWKMASITDFEKSMITDHWRSIIRDHPYWTESVFHRLFSNYPETKRLHVFGINMKGSIQDGDATNGGNPSNTGK